jgi:hypothetical protein
MSMHDIKRCTDEADLDRLGNHIEEGQKQCV